MPIVRYAILALACGVLLPACQPSYTVEQTKLYARKLGVTNQFDIHRRNTRVIAGNSRICIVSKPQQEVDMQAVSTIVATGLSPFFHNVTAIEAAPSMHLATTMARRAGADIVIYIDLINSRSQFKYEKPNPSIEYNRLQLLLTLVDINNGEVVDKVQLLAKPSHFSLAGEDLQSLLAAPVTTIGHDLSGTQL